ncbi:baseplate J/gp47 family protein (plasmid) [Paenibacillus sp. EC2-1]|uniref:baseplate J/gp47 family protein n=1 Tax=Paenibacillus sp. EC2-1 TaxID=3388665 RepID=UPI003BEF04E9
MIFNDKQLSDIMEESLKEMEGMGITEVEAGGVARLILSIVNKRIAGYYDTLRENIMMPFVSKSKGPFLDMVGKILDCDRLPEEINDDEPYRYRITKQIQRVAGGNHIAIRLAILSVPGVQDVKLKRFTHGTGSFSAYVVTEDPITPQYILDEVNEKIQEGVESFGVRAEAFRPVVIPVEMKVRLIFLKTVTDLDKKLAIAQSEEQLKHYLNSRNVGDSLEIDLVYELIKGVHEGIDEVVIFQYNIANRPVLTVDQACAWNERFIQSDKPNAIQVM